ncbi:hypothetical protein [Rothia terrae]|uniref:Uncharacterized protein n=1 Tax=Rothia terrae TaxID=396015 RepID=A0A7S6WX72_9MICC|nr:hypothetical protein [Rothia terrae]QOW64754.1 hypothetical protein IDM49_11735 [Rothia terrae]
MKIEQLMSFLPSAFGALSVLCAGLFENRRAKEIQERIRKNSELLEKFQPENPIYQKLEPKILRDIERLEEEDSKQRDWSALVIAVIFFAITAPLAREAYILWAQEHVVFSATLWVMAITAGIFSLYAFVGWVIPRKPEDFITRNKKEKGNKDSS